MTLEEEIILLRDALDHIARIANSARIPTKRLDWIAARSREALIGEPWSREYLPEPNNNQVDQRIKDIQSALYAVINACESQNSDNIRASVEEVRSRFPSLFRKKKSLQSNEVNIT